ncbi:MAG TPA: hypothetical protein VEP90_02515, partial [Methylomirabilota bacterium]|nr:hypothetical protein [Methylomirabilota bacterium]
GLIELSTISNGCTREYTLACPLTSVDLRPHPLKVIDFLLFTSDKMKLISSEEIFLILILHILCGHFVTANFLT